MNPNLSADGESSSAETEDSQGSPRKIPSVASLFHILWLRKWVALALWLMLALPIGVALSIFDLPRSYSASTVMRFPQVVGAQTNVMRDVAITEGQSIISIFNSYQVLDASIRKLGLRLRITTREVFRHDVFKDIRYGEQLGEGTYDVAVEKGGTFATVTYKPSAGNAEYKIFSGPMQKDGRLSMPGLDLEFAPGFLAGPQDKKVQLALNPLEETFQNLRRNLSVNALGDGGNFEIGLRDRDPWMVAEILNTLRDQFLEVYYGTTEVQDVGILVQMEKDMALSKERLEKSQDELSQYYASHPELVQQSGSSGSENLAYLESRQMIDNHERRKKRVQDAFAAKEPDASPEKLFFWANELLVAMAEAGEAKANILRSSLSEANIRQAELLRSLSPGHPKIEEVEKEKQALYVQIEETEAALVRKMDQELSDLKVRMASNVPKTASRPAVKVQLELERLNNVNHNNQNIYDRLVESYNRAKLVTGSEFFKVSVVDPARPALYEPPSLKTRLAMAGAAVVALIFVAPGLVIGWAIIFIKIWTKDDVKRLLNLKAIGVVVERKPLRSRKPKSKGKSKEAKDANEADEDEEIKPTGVDPMLVGHGRNSILEDVESYRSIREEIENHFRNPKAAGRFCIMVSSCRPHDGKSTCAANIAITFARKGKRTLLVDADFRLGRVAKLFNLPVGTGLDSILDQSDMNMEEFLEASTMVLLPTVQRNLVIAPSKSPKSNASELISSDRFKAFIKFARQQFDVVVIDTSPVMITPEPLSLAELTDGVVFVCRSGVTSAREAREAVEAMMDRNGRVVALLNGIQPSPFEANRYRKYSYYYSVQPTEGKPGD